MSKLSEYMASIAKSGNKSINSVFVTEGLTRPVERVKVGAAKSEAQSIPKEPEPQTPDIKDMSSGKVDTIQSNNEPSTIVQEEAQEPQSRPKLRLNVPLTKAEEKQLDDELLEERIPIESEDSFIMRVERDCKLSILNGEAVFKTEKGIEIVDDDDEEPDEDEFYQYLQAQHNPPVVDISSQIVQQQREEINQPQINKIEEPKSEPKSGQNDEPKPSQPVQKQPITGENELEILFIRSGTPSSLRDNWFAVIEKARRSNVNTQFNQKVRSGRFRFTIDNDLEILPDLDTYGKTSKELLSMEWQGRYA